VRTVSSGASSLRIPKFLWSNESFSYIGVFGNADPLDSTQWMEMTMEEQTSAPVLDEASRSCNYMTTTLNYEFLVARVGATGSPQAKIVGARAYYGSENIVFASELGTQGILLTTTVSFVSLDSANTDAYSPPPPPILLSVPYDVFYPFDVSGARERPEPSIVVVAATVVLSVIAWM